jgi:hypothetical protein
MEPKWKVVYDSICENLARRPYCGEWVDIVHEYKYKRANHIANIYIYTQIYTYIGRHVAYYGGLCTSWRPWMYVQQVTFTSPLNHL